MKPQADAHARREGSKHRAQAFIITRIAGPRKRAATGGIGSGECFLVARKVQMAVGIDEGDARHHSDRPPFSKPTSEQIT